MVLPRLPRVLRPVLRVPSCVSGVDFKGCVVSDVLVCNWPLRLEHPLAAACDVCMTWQKLHQAARFLFLFVLCLLVLPATNPRMLFLLGFRLVSDPVIANKSL